MVKVASLDLRKPKTKRKQRKMTLTKKAMDASIEICIGFLAKGYEADWLYEDMVTLILKDVYGEEDEVVVKATSTLAAKLIRGLHRNHKKTFANTNWDDDYLLERLVRLVDFAVKEDRRFRKMELQKAKVAVELARSEETFERASQ